MWLTILTACILACAIAMFLAALTFETSARRERRAVARAEVASTELAMSGDILATFTLRGCSHDVGVTLTSDTEAKVPGASGQRRRACLVEVAVESCDLLVCKRADMDLIMGPLQTAPRVLTADRNFDEQYAIFISQPDAFTHSTSSYRTGPAEPLAWAQPEMLAAMRDLGLMWLRIREQRCEVALEPIEAVNAAAAISVGVNMARAAHGRSLVTPPPVEVKKPQTESRLPLHFVASFTLSAMTFWLAAPLLAMTPILRALSSESLCGSGKDLAAEVHFVGREPRFHAHCSDGREVSSSYYLQCTALYVAFVFFVNAWIVLSRQWQRKD